MTKDKALEVLSQVVEIALEQCELDTDFQLEIVEMEKFLLKTLHSHQYDENGDCKICKYVTG